MEAKFLAFGNFIFSYKNNAFLEIFRLKFCLNASERYLLLRVKFLKCPRKSGGATSKDCAISGH